MLFFALLLTGVPGGPDPRGDRAFPRILDLVTPDCAQGACDPGRRYRLDAEPVAGERAKDRALRGVWQPCATTGASVCPTRPRQILREEFD